jgi:alginate O-acetyltransferase complex protein AlgI
MVTVAKRTRKGHTIGAWAWLPLIVLPAVSWVAAADAPRWVLMWALAVSIFAGLKWMTFAEQRADRRLRVRALGYLFAWPGLDAESFFSRGRVERPRAGEWIFALSKTLLGVGLLCTAISAGRWDTLSMGWVGMVGLVFMLHFGIFHLLSLCWRRAGVDARPMMEWPMLARSVAEFWGRRWNLAFRDVAARYAFRALAGRIGAAGATMVVFVGSGLVHDLVISVPAEGGYGLPTTYFVVQGIALLFERSRFARRVGLGDGIAGRVFCAAVVIGLLPMLFHVPFVQRVIVPMVAFC